MLLPIFSRLLGMLSFNGILGSAFCMEMEIQTMGPELGYVMVGMVL